jgi:hypothetical protein
MRNLEPVIPAEAGIHFELSLEKPMDTRFRGYDGMG